MRKTKITPKGVSGNPEGRPPSLINIVNSQLTAKGYRVAKKSEINEAFLILIQLPQHEIKALAEDENAPIMFHLMSKSLASKSGVDMLEKLLDRSIGKPSQEIKTQAHNKVEFEFISQGEDIGSPSQAEGDT